MIVEALYGAKDIREEEWPKPEPKAGEVRVQIKSVCIGESDVALFENGGTEFEKVPVPFLLGKEASGIVDSIGSEVEGFIEGTPVVIYPYISCGKCEYCLSGKNRFCKKIKTLGTPPEHGALAEYVVLPSENIFPLNAKVSFAEIACINPLARGIYASQMLGSEFSKKTAAIFGADGLGISCLIASKTYGAKIVSISDSMVSRLVVAEKYGAENIINSFKKDVSEEIIKLTNGKGVDLAFVTSCESQSIINALKSLAPGGKLAIVGRPSEELWKIPSSILSSKETTIKIVHHSKNSFLTAIDWVVEGKINLSHLISDKMSWEFSEKAFEKMAGLEEGILKISLEPEEKEEIFYI